MLQEKGGVITEERFQKMTYVQWMFHYQECMKKKEKEDKKYLDFIQLLETFAFYSHPNINLDKAWSNIQQRRLKMSAKETAAEMTETYEQAMKVLPKTLHVIEDAPEEKKFLPQVHVPKKKKRKKKKDL